MDTHNKLFFNSSSIVYIFDLGANLLPFPCLRIVRKEYQTIVREADVYLPNFTLNAENVRPLHQCRSGTFSKWIAGHVQKPVDFQQSFLKRLLSLRRYLSLTLPVFRKLLTSCNPRERNLKVSYLEISEALFRYWRAFRWKCDGAPSC